MSTVHWEASIHHDGSPTYLRFSGRPGDTAVFRLRMAADAPVSGVFLRTAQMGNSILRHYAIWECAGCAGGGKVSCQSA